MEAEVREEVTKEVRELKACDGCGIDSTSITLSIKHEPSCIKEFTQDGSCLCPGAQGALAANASLDSDVTKKKQVELKTLSFHGRKLELCENCYAREYKLMNEGQINLHSYDKNIPDKIEHVLNNFTREKLTVAHWQEVYSTERPNWVVENFENLDEMRAKLVEFITSMELLSWEAQTKKRAAFDAAKELDTRLNKADRDRLVNDPSFRPATNSEFKKIAEERTLDIELKALGIEGLELNKKTRAAIKSLMAMGISAADIKKQLKL